MCNRFIDCSRLTNPGLVPKMLINYPLLIPLQRNLLCLPYNTQKMHPLHKTMWLLPCHLPGDVSKTKIPKAVSKYIVRSWRSATQKQYNTYLKQWQIFCNTRGIHPISAPIKHALEFLAQLADRGLRYSTINTDRSALFTTLVLPNGAMFRQHMYVKRLLKGVFETKPALPRYTVVWDIGVVLTYIKNLGPNKELTLKLLTFGYVT